MTIDELLTELGARAVEVHRQGHELVLRGARTVLDDELVAHLRAHKSALLERLRDESRGDAGTGSRVLTPDLFPLARLTAEDLERIVETVPGGADNIQDIYRLAPLQEGILFHHLLEGQADPYVIATQLSFDTRERLDRFLDAVRTVVARHDILRTAVVWERLSEPVQVVWRRASLSIEEVTCAADDRPVSEQLWTHVDPRRCRMDLRRAPWLRMFVAYDPRAGRWHLLQLRHHLSGDHGTTDVMRQEIEACLLGRERTLPPPVPFRNHVAATCDEHVADHEAFFRRMLSDVVEPSAPFGLRNVQGDGLGIREARVSVDARVASRLRAAAQSLKMTTAPICHLAWALVVGRLSGRDDVVFGTALLGRMHGTDADRATGMFLNTLPLRVRLDSETVEIAVRGVHLGLVELLAHENASLALAQRCSGVEAPAPLFSAALNFRHSASRVRDSSADSQRAWQGIEHVSLSEEERTNYPFTLAVDDTGDGFRLTAQVSTPIDPIRVCGYMHTAIEQVVEALARTPCPAVCTLDVLPRAERRQLLEQWGRGKRARPTHRYFHEIFEAQAATAAAAPAVICGEATVTYAVLNQRANQLAHLLRARGVGPECIVGLYLERSIEQIVGLLGILKAGGAYLPLDPSHPPERLAYMIADSGSSAIVTSGALAASLPRGTAVVVALGADQAEIARQPTTDPVSEVRPDNLAYVIYTSGSTGMPKAVLVPHEGVGNLADAQSTYFDVAAGQRVLQFARLGFDASVSEIAVAFRVGAALCLIPAAESSIGAELPRALERYAVDVAMLPPAALPLVATASGARLRTLVVGGEACPPSVAATFAGRLRFVNAYGPTEATVCATLAHYTGEDVASLPIGRPISNTDVYVLDAHLRPVPAGVAGELYLGGIALARGYLNRAGLTAERFVANPFGRAGCRLYRTGDHVRYLEDGSLEFIGRVDGQVRVRSHRIELGEIEATLRTCAGVHDCVVVTRGDGDRKDLIAYVAIGDASPLDPESMATHLRHRVPEYMVPAVFVQLPRLPLGPNGKVDRRALPDAGLPERPLHPAPPRTAVESTLSVIWSEVLGVENVGIDDNFFELGGDSIRAIHILSRASQAGLRILVKDLFEHPTIAALAPLCAASEPPTAGEPDTPGPDRRSQTLPGAAPIRLPLMPMHRWCLDALGSDFDRYVLVLSRECARRVDPPTLRRAFARVIAHHESLHLRFCAEDVEWSLENPSEIAAATDEWLDVVDSAPLESASPRERVLRDQRDRLRSLIDLPSGRPLRAALVDFGGDGEQQLIVAIHHAVADAISVSVLFEDLQTAYEQLQSGAVAALPGGTRYRDWVTHLSGFARSKQIEADAAYWKGLPWHATTPLPIDAVGDAGTSPTGDVLEALEDSATTLLLGVVQRGLQAPLEDVITAAAVHALAQWTGGSSFAVSLRRHGRSAFPAFDVSRAIGWFSTTVPLVLAADDALDPAALVKSIGHQLRAVPRDGIAYGVLRYLERDAFFVSLEPPRMLVNHLGHLGAPRADTLFRRSDDRAADRATDRERLERDDHSLALTTTVRRGRLSMEWSFRPDRHRRDAVERLASRTRDWLLALSTDAAVAVSSGASLGRGHAI